MASPAPAVPEAELDAQYWAAEAQAAIEVRLAHRESKQRARNVVMFLGDGMSVPTLAAARTLLGQRHGATGEEAQLAFEKFPTVGLAKVNITQIFACCIFERILLHYVHIVQLWFTIFHRSSTQAHTTAQVVTHR